MEPEQRRKIYFVFFWILTAFAMLSVPECREEPQDFEYYVGFPITTKHGHASQLDPFDFLAWQSLANLLLVGAAVYGLYRLYLHLQRTGSISASIARVVAWTAFIYTLFSSFLSYFSVLTVGWTVAKLVVYPLIMLFIPYTLFIPYSLIFWAIDESPYHPFFGHLYAFVVIQHTLTLLALVVAAAVIAYPIIRWRRRHSP